MSSLNNISTDRCFFDTLKQVKVSLSAVKFKELVGCVAVMESDETDLWSTEFNFLTQLQVVGYVMECTHLENAEQKLHVSSTHSNGFVDSSYEHQE